MHVQLCVQDKQTNNVYTLIGKTLTFCCLHEFFLSSFNLGPRGSNVNKLSSVNSNVQPTEWKPQNARHRVVKPWSVSPLSVSPYRAAPIVIVLCSRLVHLLLRPSISI